MEDKKRTGKLEKVTVRKRLGKLVKIRRSKAQ